MPTAPVSNNPLVSQHHAALSGLSRSLMRAMRSPQLVGLDKSSPKYAALLAALVQEFSAASTALNLDYYDDARTEAGITTPFRAPITPPPDADKVTTSLTEVSTIADPVLAQSKAEGVADLLVVTAGKNALIAAIMGDGKAKKWARVTGGSACAFCRMLATRGAVYRSDSTASFVPHPKCHCTIEAVFHPESYEPTAATRADQALYAKATVHTKPGEGLNAFRRALNAQKRGEEPSFAGPRAASTAPSGASQYAALKATLDAAMRVA